MTPQSDLVILVGRVFMALLFIISGFSKLTAAAGTKAYFTKIGVPVPDIAYIVSVAVELGVGILFLVGFKTRIMAVVLAVFTVATAVLGHGEMAQQTQFLKNLAIAGGFLGFAMLGGGAYSVDGQMARPGRGRVGV